MQCLTLNKETQFNSISRAINAESSPLLIANDLESLVFECKSLATYLHTVSVFSFFSKLDVEHIASYVTRMTIFFSNCSNVAFDVQLNE